MPIGLALARRVDLDVAEKLLDLGIRNHQATEARKNFQPTFLDAPVDVGFVNAENFCSLDYCVCSNKSLM